MNEMMIMAIGLAVLSVASGMLGLGVAFAAVPFLGLFLHDLVHEVQPLSLLLNGVTALFALFGFARSGLVLWKPAVLLAIVTTVVAPLGAYLAQIVDARYLLGALFRGGRVSRLPHVRSREASTRCLPLGHRSRQSRFNGSVASLEV